MPMFVYSSLVLPGKLHLVDQSYTYRSEHPERSDLARAFNESVGVESWQAWLQKTPTYDLFLHGIEAPNFIDFFHRLQQQIQAGNTRAQWLRDFYLSVFGKDYAHSSAVPEIEPLMSMDAPARFTRQEQLYTRAYAFPIRPNKVHDHREFSRQCMGEYRFRVVDSCNQFGITRLIHYLQKTPHQDYLVCYEEREVLSADQEKQLAAARSKNPSWQWFSSVLAAHTGLPLQQLEPQVQSLTPQPISTMARSAVTVA